MLYNNIIASSNNSFDIFFINKLIIYVIMIIDQSPTAEIYARTVGFYFVEKDVKIRYNK